METSNSNMATPLSCMATPLSCRATPKINRETSFRIKRETPEINILDTNYRSK